jgi:gas vesicle protein
LLATIRRASALAVFVTLAPLAAAAQTRPMSAEVPGTRSLAPGAASTRESVINWYGELQSISRHLQGVHDRALQDPALRQARDRLMSTIQQAMDRSDPELPRLAQRVEQIQEEMAAARQRNDAARFQALEHEQAQIQARFMRVRGTVLRQPDIARQARAYEEQLRLRMIQIEPLTENLLARSAEVQRLLQQALGQQPSPRQ